MASLNICIRDDWGREHWRCVRLCGPMGSQLCSYNIHPADGTSFLRSALLPFLWLVFGGFGIFWGGRVGSVVLAFAPGPWCLIFLLAQSSAALLGFLGFSVSAVFLGLVLVVLVLGPLIQDG